MKVQVQPKAAISMNAKKWLWRIPAAVLVCTGLAYPVCAAVCPKGIGSCPYPGRCFQFTDADGNSLCDYTARTATTGSGTTQSVAPAPASVPSPADPVSAPSVIPPDLVSLTAIGAGIVAGVVLTLVLFRAFRSGRIRIGNTAPAPAFALALLISLGISGIIACALAGTAMYGTAFALLYMAAGTPLALYLWWSNAMDRRVVLGLAGISSLAGFVFLAPIMPAEFNGLAGIFLGGQTLTPAILGIGFVLALAVLSGRVFCAHLCPVGAIQELAYALPGKKIIATRAPEVIRLGIFLAAVVAAAYSVNLVGLTGIYDFFSLTVTAGFFVAAGLLMTGIFLYRPVCRLLCPFGVLFAALSLFPFRKMQRTGACISCGKCEKACPTGAAGEGASKRECYLCGRCGEVCPADAIRMTPGPEGGRVPAPLPGPEARNAEVLRYRK